MKIAQIQREVVYKTARSSGSGGQHVNKVETKIELYFDIEASEGLSETEKNRLQKNLPTRIS
ncbi:MAG: peptide chain release factor-like protein, partial [Bacteroidota bacterium]